MTEAVATQEKQAVPIARRATLSVEYDREKQRSSITAEFGTLRWVAGPWGGNWNGRQYSVWNKHRERFVGPNIEVRNALPEIHPEDTYL